MNQNDVRDNCPFCEYIRNQEPAAERRTFVAKYDDYPISEGHMLLVPRRHIETFFALSREELEDFYDLLLEVRAIIEKELEPDGFNVGVNIGLAAGQTIPHLHIHVIPRYFKDVENPRGGVRCVIPDLADYTSAATEPDLQR